MIVIMNVSGSNSCRGYTLEVQPLKSNKKGRRKKVMMILELKESILLKSYQEDHTLI